MDVPTIVSYAGIIISVLWTAYQEIRFQIHKMKANFVTNMVNSYPLNGNLSIPPK